MVKSLFYNFQNTMIDTAQVNFRLFLIFSFIRVLSKNYNLFFTCLNTIKINIILNYNINYIHL